MKLELTNGEAALIDRALRLYAAHHQQQITVEMHEVNRADLKSKVAAADRVLVKLRAARGLEVARG